MAEPSAAADRLARQLSVLRVVAALLAVAVVVEGVILYQHIQRSQRIVQRLDDLQVAADLGLGEQPGKLLVITSEDAGFSIRQLRGLQASALSWLDDFVQRHQVEPEAAELLAGVLSAYLAAYGDTRIQQAVGGISDTQAPDFERALLDRCARTGDLVLGPEVGRAFGDELRKNWDGWTAELKQAR